MIINFQNAIHKGKIIIFALEFGTYAISFK